MPDRILPDHPSLEQYRKQAKELCREAAAGMPMALTRMRKHHPQMRDLEADRRRAVSLADAQLVLAREHGYESWPKFAKHIEKLRMIRAAEHLEDPLNSFIEAACVDRHGWHGSGTLEYAELILSRYLHGIPGNIFSAAVLGDAEAVRTHLLKDPSLARATGGPHGWDALTYLCFSRYLRLDRSRSASFMEAARALLEAGADANTGWTEYIDEPPRPVREAAIYGAAGLAQNAGVTKLLLEYGADPNDEETPYHVAETADNTVLGILLESGRFDQRSLATLLARKCDWHDEEGLRMVLEHGGGANFLTRWKVSPLHHAIRRDNGLRMIEMLLDHGADPYLPNRYDGRNAFQMAAYYGRGDLLKSLEQRGFASGLEGVDALAGACARGDARQASELAGGDRLAELLAQGGSLLARFAGANNTDGVECLLGLGVSPAARWTEGDPYWELSQDSTALHVAAWRAHHEMVHRLIAAGTPVDARDARNRTALQLAVKACTDSYWKRRRRPDSVAALLAAGATTEGIDLPTGYEAIDELLLGKQPQERGLCP